MEVFQGSQPLVWKQLQRRTISVLFQLRSWCAGLLFSKFNEQLREVYCYLTAVHPNNQHQPEKGYWCDEAAICTYDCLLHSMKHHLPVGIPCSSWLWVPFNELKLDPTFEKNNTLPILHILPSFSSLWYYRGFILLIICDCHLFSSGIWDTLCFVSLRQGLRKY